MFPGLLGRYGAGICDCDGPAPLPVDRDLAVPHREDVLEVQAPRHGGPGRRSQRQVDQARQ